MSRGLRIALVAALLIAGVAVAVIVTAGDSDDEGGGGARPSHRAPDYLGPRTDRGWMPSRQRSRSVVWAIGDGADGGADGRAVATMVAADRVDRLLYLGDVYETGTAEEFAMNYAPLFGRFDSVTAPTIGNHEWPNIASGYVPYWTAVRGTPPPLWYAFAVSGWQLISLNSNVPDSPDQLRWLDAIIERTPRYGDCRIVFAHHPFFSAGLHGDLDALQPAFDELRGHATIALAGHDHDMQRLLPVDGITQYVDGSGGNELYPVNRDDPRLAFADDSHHGALRIALRPERASLLFFAEDGTALDRSTVNCRQG
jgi:acid phosphatase type 7